MGGFVTAETKSTLTQQAAKRLKLFRKQKGLSVAVLAEKIHRSPATVYKYESGQIPLDMVTLEEISRVLGVPPAYFFEIPVRGGITGKHASFLEDGRLYAYYYDGRIRQISRSLLTFGEEKEGEIQTVLYMHLRNFEEPESARYLYHGTMIPHETVSCFVLENVTMPMETLVIQLLHPFQNSLTSWGLFMGISDHPAAPMAAKMLFSRRVLTKKELEEYPLVFTREEMRRIRQRNSLFLAALTREDG